MDFSSYLSVTWGQLFGYSAGTALAFQSVKSTYLGTKEILSAFNGSETYGERIKRAASDNLNILSNIKNFVVGSDLFSKRFSHFINGLENLSIAVISGLFSYLLFFKAFETSGANNLPPPPDTSKLDRDHIKNLNNATKASQAAKEHNCIITNFFNPTSKATLFECNKKGYFSNGYYLPENLSDYVLSELEDILDCLKEYSILLRIERIFSKPEVQNLIANTQISAKAISTDLTQNNDSAVSVSNINSSSLFSSSENGNAQLKSVFDQYLEGFPKIHQEILNNYAEYLNGHQKRLEHFVKTNMTYTAGPFDVHLDKFCDDNLFNKLPFLNNLDSKYCSEYNNLKKALHFAYKEKGKIDNLKPTFLNTNCRSEVFEKIFANINELDLPPNLRDAFEKLKDEIEKRHPNQKA